jgi:hypothetical protein
MQYPIKRETTAISSTNGYSKYENWQESVNDYKLWQEFVFDRRGDLTKTEYLAYLQKWYAEDTASSSLGRAIILLKGSNKTATKDSMKIVEADQKQNEYEKKHEQRRYGAPGTKSAAVEDALRASFAVDNKQDDPQAWSVAEAVDAIGSSTPKEPPACEHGHILKQGISKTGKPYYGYVCKGKVTEHAKWAKMTANGHWFFEGME